MNLGPVTKLEKGNTSTSRNFDDGFMSENCDAIVFFQFMANLPPFQKPDSGRMVYKNDIFVNSNLFCCRI